MSGILPCAILCAIPPPRVLILTADIGAGHDLPAELLSDAILATWEPGTTVMVADGLRNQGRIIRTAIRTGSESVLERAPWAYDLEYRLVSVWPATVALTGWLGERLGSPRLLELIEETRPDVVVSTYPGATELLGRARAGGRLAIPVVGAITDLAALRYWANPGLDLHLIIHEESRAEVQEIAGAEADIRLVRGLSRPEFERPPSRAEARAALDLPAEGPVVVVSGGGWGVGELEPAARVVLGIPGATAVCLCGSNDALKARLDEIGGAEHRLRAVGFTDRMAEWLAAAEVLVHSTAGLTVLEAQLCGTRTISYGWGVGHIRLNNRAYERFGLADVATTEAELDRALRTALAAPPLPRPDYASLPSAADAVRELIRARPSTAG